jgi:DNA-directed RNA polymerase specialized sigma24 family protein
VDPAAVSTIATLFRDHHGELVRLALLMVGDLPTAEDVVQDVYTRLYQRWSQVAAADSPLPYVRAAVLAALTRLPCRRREVLVLRYYLGLSEAEIAAILGISPGTVKSTAARAPAALAHDLGEKS